MKRLVTSDWQLCDNSRDRYRTDWVVNELPKLIEKHKPDQLLVLGDLTESKDGHPAPLVNEIVNCFCNLAESVEIVILQGNHDFLHNGHPFFAFLENFKSIHWISKPEVLDGCLYLPHTRDYKKDWKGIDFNGHDFIFAHNIFEGVKANGQALSGIPHSIFPSDCFIVSGDVHEPQTLGVINYVGSPFTTDFGDDYQSRVLLLDGLNVKSIKVHGPQKRVVEVLWKEGMQFRRVGDFNPGDIVKVKVFIGTENIATWNEIRTKIESFLVDDGAIVNSILPIVEYVAGKRASLALKDSKKSDLDYLKSFLLRFGVDDRTSQVGLEILEND